MSIFQNKINEGYESDKLKLSILVSIFLYFILALYVSPVLCFYLIIITLTQVEFKIHLRIPLCLILIISGSLIFSSRQLGLVTGDDFYNEYYPLYLDVFEKGNIFSGNFGGGLELGLAIYYKIISIFNNNTPAFVMFMISFFNLSMFYIWVEKFYFSKDTKNKCLIIGSLFAFVGLFSITQLTRQSLSTPFVLFAISYFNHKMKVKGVLSLVIAAMFHLTAVPIFIIFYIFMYGSLRSKVIVCSSIVLFSLMFKFIISGVVGSNLFWGIQSKLAYYSYNDLEVESHYFTRHLILAVIFCFILNRKIDIKNNYISLLFFSAIGYISLLPIPFASDRIFMPLTSYILGAVLILVFSKIRKIYVILLIFYCVFRFLQLGPLYNTQCTNTIYCLWHYYPWLGSVFN